MIFEMFQVRKKRATPYIVENEVLQADLPVRPACGFTRPYYFASTVGPVRSRE